MIILGNEYDTRLKSVLSQVLNDMGYQCQGESYGIGGSQELQTRHFKRDDDSITIESETYIGLSITGNPEIIKKVEAEVKKRILK